MKPVTKLVIAILPLLILIGCGEKAVKPEEESAKTGVVVGEPGGGVTTAEPSEGERLGEEGLGGGVSAGEQAGQAAEAAPEAPDLLSERKIYFDFDKSEIKDEFKDILLAHATFLVEHPDVAIVIEGHCDERGTREYNMALGERRAHSVAQFLMLQGVSKNQIRTVSFGEERPDVEGHDESAWKWNRRAVIVYPEDNQ